MPATAGRVRMPANNRVHSSAALQTHGIWQSAIGYDPYAPNKDDAKSSAPNMAAANSEPKAENSYTCFQDLLALARITGSNADEARGACKKCGHVGHLTVQCRNFLNMKDGNEEKDTEAVQAALASFPGLDKLKGSANKASGKSEAESEEDSNEEEDESETSDSDVDLEIERVIAKREGKKVITKGTVENLSKKKRRDGSEDDDSDSDLGERTKRGRSKKRKSGRRRSSLSEDKDEVRRKMRKARRRKRDESSDEEEHRRRHRKSKKDERRRKSHRHTDDSSSDESGDSNRRHRKKSWRVAASSASQASSSDDLRVGRDRKRSAKSSRRHRHKEDDSS
ncbi:CAX-interacting protein 4-like [Rhodamnia argentea]|uniref:CAX-interacting protein 4-like n=1 Tax=Rhodamnia argentea TaxID=178133 RepID=A0ABM3HS28_9MYRT|nr:CAX-interacting protein 4-like [Rhodamnia argentea]XP_048139409.1 CAX-interacting protein 4-like [Rhodamnia argentea]XP_048139411.1 CAX-interacting protein 4-like [Rhodamnia argentea]XP_048139412.1 CAX-interacting protein 4-like [Rhodamnia argentea]